MTEPEVSAVERSAISKVSWRLTPFIVICFVVQDLTRIVLFCMSATAVVKLRRGRMVLAILRTLVRGLLWLCVLEFVEMLVALAEQHVICDAPKLEQRAMCEIGADLYVVIRTGLTLVVLLYCMWIAAPARRRQRPRRATAARPCPKVRGAPVRRGARKSACGS